MTLTKLLAFVVIGLEGRLLAEFGIIAAVLVSLTIFVIDRQSGGRGRR